MAGRRINTLTLADLHTAHAALSMFFRDDPEPIPPWESGDIALLEMCCGCSEVAAFGTQKYPDLVGKAAKIFYSGIKLHCFQNGNKRFGLSVLVIFLYRNNKRLEATPGAMKDLAEYVAKTKPHEADGRPDKIVEELRDRLQGLIFDGLTSRRGN
jgi:death-on-curing family protein